MCKNRPQKLHFLVVTKKVYQLPGTFVSWNPRNQGPGGGVPPQERCQTSTPPAAPLPNGGTYRLQIMPASGGDALLTLRGQPVPPIPALHNFPSRESCGPQSGDRRQNPESCLGVFPYSPAPEEYVIGPGHGKGNKLLQLPIARPALGVCSFLRDSGGSAASGGQVPGVAKQKLPAVAPVFVSLTVAAQRLHPGGHSRVLAQILRHLLRHIVSAGRGSRGQTPHRQRGKCGRRAALSLRPAPAALQRTPLGRPKPQTTVPTAAEPPTSARRRLLSFYNLAAAERPRVLPARLSQDALRRLGCCDAAAPTGG